MMFRKMSITFLWVISIKHVFLSVLKNLEGRRPCSFESMFIKRKRLRAGHIFAKYRDKKGTLLSRVFVRDHSLFILRCLHTALWVLTNTFRYGGNSIYFTLFQKSLYVRVFLGHRHSQNISKLKWQWTGHSCRLQAIAGHWRQFFLSRRPNLHWSAWLPPRLKAVLNREEQSINRNLALGLFKNCHLHQVETEVEKNIIRKNIGVGKKLKDWVYFPICPGRNDNKLMWYFTYIEKNLLLRLH